MLEKDQLKRHLRYRLLFRDMERALVSLKGKPYHMSCKKVLSALINESGVPTSQDLLELKPIFANRDGVFHLKKISARHVRHLMVCHGLKDWFWWRDKLRQHGNLINQIDKSIAREDIATLEDEELRKCCYMRGLNAGPLNRSEMLNYLQEWVEISVQLDQKSVSLLLHLPILLGYNHKSRIWDTETVE